MRGFFGGVLMEFLTSCAHPRSPENMVEQRPQLSCWVFARQNSLGVTLCRYRAVQNLMIKSEKPGPLHLSHKSHNCRESFSVFSPNNMASIANASACECDSPGAPAICMDTHLRTSARPGEALHPMHWEEPEYRELPEQLRSAAATGSGGRDLHQLRTQEWWASSSEVFRSTQKLRCLMFGDVG